VNASDLAIVSTEINDITNTSFTTTCVAAFSNLDGPTVSLQMNSVTLGWNYPNIGGDMVDLDNTNSLVVKNNGQSTMISSATVTNQETFADFNKYLMHNTGASWSLSGTANVQFIINALVDINKNIDLVGFNNFSVAPIVSSTNLTGGTPTILYSTASVTITSLSNVQLDLNQNLYYHFVYNGQRLGIGSIPNYVIKPGSVTQDSYIEFSYTTDAEREGLMTLLSYYSCGIDVNASMENFYTVPPITWLAPALDSISMTATLPAATDPMVLEVIIYELSDPDHLYFQLVLYNPQPIPVTVWAIVGNMTYKDTLIATVDLTDISPAIVIPPHSNTTSQQLRCDSYVNEASLELIKNGGGLGNLYNDIGANFTDFPSTFYYQQLNVTMTVVQSH
jgi:hypothetical protein